MPTFKDDGDLIAQILAGEIDFYEDLIEKYQRGVFNFAYMKVGSFSTAQDVVQETFLKAYRSLARFNPEYKFITWLLAICTNVCINHFNQEKRRSGYFRDAVAEEDFMVHGVDAFENVDNADLVGSILTDLNEEERALLYLRFWQEMCHNEIAEILEVPSGTVRSKLCRLLKKLRGRVTVPGDSNSEKDDEK